METARGDVAARVTSRYQQDGMEVTVTVRTTVVPSGCQMPPETVAATLIAAMADAGVPFSDGIIFASPAAIRDAIETATTPSEN